PQATERTKGMPNDLTHGFLISISGEKLYDRAKSEFPNAGWIAVPDLSYPKAGEALSQQWLRASVELTAKIPQGVAIDRDAIRAGRARVGDAIEKMFNPGATSLDDVVAAAVAELTNVAGYPDLDTLVEKSGIQDKARKQALADAVRTFEDACFSAAMAGVALLENANQLVTPDTPDETLAKLRLVDTADRLYDEVGDPPAGLFINKDEDPGSYVTYACADVQPKDLAPAHSGKTFQVLFEHAL